MRRWRVARATVDHPEARCRLYIFCCVAHALTLLYNCDSRDGYTVSSGFWCIAPGFYCPPRFPMFRYQQWIWICDPSMHNRTRIHCERLMENIDAWFCSRRIIYRCSRINFWLNPWKINFWNMCWVRMDNIFFFIRGVYRDESVCTPTRKWRRRLAHRRWA